MRLSDLYHPKNFEKTKGLSRPGVPKTDPVPLFESVRASPQAPRKEPRTAAPLERPEPPPGAGSGQVYGSMVRMAQEMLAGFSQNPVRFPDLDSICEQIECLLESLGSNPACLLEMTSRSTPDDYLPGHVVNVAILTSAVGLHLRWPQETLRSVALGCLLHDAGMVLGRQPASQSRFLISIERKTTRKSPKECVEILAPFLGILAPETRNQVETILGQAQERISGKGYPNKLKGEQIAWEAQLVGLCDTYESLTHPREHRERKIPQEALRHLIELAGESFDGNLIKALWETLTLFPPGSFVELSNHEIGRVIDIHSALPTRPVVKVIADSEGRRPREEKVLDLAQTPGVNVERAIDECAHALNDPGLVLELRAQKWWVR